MSSFKLFIERKYFDHFLSVLVLAVYLPFYNPFSFIAVIKDSCTQRPWRIPLGMYITALCKFSINEKI